MIKTIPILLTKALLLIAIQSYAQNQAIDIEPIQGQNVSSIYLHLNNNDTIHLKTHNKIKQIKCVDYYADDSFCLVLFEHYSHTYLDYLVLAAYKCNGEWYQDYIQRFIFKSNTGLSCSYIHHLSIIDGQTLNIEYQVVSEFADFDYLFKSDIKLGKYSFYETQTQQHYSFCVAGKGTEFERIQQQSPRPNLSNYHRTSN